MDIKQVTERIGYFRNKANMSARDLSLRIGKHEGYINKLESKDFNLPVSVLLEIIDCFGISAEEFFADDYMNYGTKTKLYSLIDNLSKEKKESVISLLEKM